MKYKQFDYFYAQSNYKKGVLAYRCVSLVEILLFTPHIHHWHMKNNLSISTI